MDLAIIWEFILKNPIAVSQTLLSFALVVSTVVYTYFTWGQTLEMKATREQQNQPVVRGGIDNMGPVNLITVIKNTGNGAAHDVSVKMYFEDVDSEPIEFKTPILTVGEEFEFGFPLSDDERFVTGWDRIDSLIEQNDSEGILTVEAQCEDVFGKEYKFETELNVLEIKENLSQMLRKSETEKMRKAVEGIESELSDIGKEISQEYQDERAHQELYQEVMNAVESNGVIGFSDLQYRIGVKQDRVLSNILHKMQRAGLVDYPDDKDLVFHENTEVEWVGGSYEEVDREAVGGASGAQIIEEIQSRRENSEEGEDKNEELGEVKE